MSCFRVSVLANVANEPLSEVDSPPDSPSLLSGQDSDTATPSTRTKRRGKRQVPGGNAEEARTARGKENDRQRHGSHGKSKDGNTSSLALEPRKRTLSVKGRGRKEKEEASNEDDEEDPQGQDGELTEADLPAPKKAKKGKNASNADDKGMASVKPKKGKGNDEEVGQDKNDAEDERLIPASAPTSQADNRSRRSAPPTPDTNKRARLSTTQPVTLKTPHDAGVNLEEANAKLRQAKEDLEEAERKWKKAEAKTQKAQEKMTRANEAMQEATALCAKADEKAADAAALKEEALQKDNDASRDIVHWGAELKKARERLLHAKDLQKKAEDMAREASDREARATEGEEGGPAVDDHRPTSLPLGPLSIRELGALALRGTLYWFMDTTELELSVGKLLFSALSVFKGMVKCYRLAKRGSLTLSASKCLYLSSLLQVAVRVICFLYFFAAMTSVSSGWTIGVIFGMVGLHYVAVVLIKFLVEKTHIAKNAYFAHTTTFINTAASSLINIRLAPPTLKKPGKEDDEKARLPRPKFEQVRFKTDEELKEHRRMVREAPDSGDGKGRLRKTGTFYANALFFALVLVEDLLLLGIPAAFAQSRAGSMAALCLGSGAVWWALGAVLLLNPAAWACHLYFYAKDHPWAEINGPKEVRDLVEVVGEWFDGAKEWCSGWVSWATDGAGHVGTRGHSHSHSHHIEMDDLEKRAVGRRLEQVQFLCHE